MVDGDRHRRRRPGPRRRVRGRDPRSPSGRWPPPPGRSSILDRPIRPGDAGPDRPAGGLGAGIGRRRLLDGRAPTVPSPASAPPGTSATHRSASASAVDLEPTRSGRGYWVVDDTRPGLRLRRRRLARQRRAGTGSSPASGSPACRPRRRAPATGSSPPGAGCWPSATRRSSATWAARRSTARCSTRSPLRRERATTWSASDGGIFAFGDARFAGSMGGQRLNAAGRVAGPRSGRVGLLAGRRRRRDLRLRRRLLRLDGRTAARTGRSPGWCRTGRAT